MPSNTNLIADNTTLLLEKLRKLSSGLNNPGSSLQTEEAALLELNKVLTSFYKSIKDPTLVSGPYVWPDSQPNVNLYNELWNTLLNDLSTVFTELENAESLTLSNFNFMITDANRLNARIKNVSSKLGDYILYSDNPLKDAIYSKDSFNNLSKVDSNSRLLNTEECNINQEEGVVTLPIDGNIQANIQVTEIPVINQLSNGIAGNNQELGKLLNGDIMTILDGNADTWFEYEKIVQVIGLNEDPLLLDITINFGEVRILNNIRINPTNFGKKSIVKIEEIESSTDGKTFISVKDDLPIAGWDTNDEENIFTLAPSTSKYAGQGIYTFTPRKAKYVRFLFRQDEAYVIETPIGNRMRYAIGIRDIIFSAYMYKNKGEVISLPFEFQDEVKKVLLDTNQNPSAPSQLADVEWFISVDNGSRWHEIQPFKRSVLSGIESPVPEVINFNTSDPKSISTAIPVRTLTVKAVLHRDDAAFKESNSTLSISQLLKSELVTVPVAEPFTLALTEAPIDGTVSVIDPMCGSCGIPSIQYQFAKEEHSQQIYILPDIYKNMEWPQKKTESSTGRWKQSPYDIGQIFHVEVNGERWTSILKPFDQYTYTPSAPNDTKFYALRRENRLDESLLADGATFGPAILQFGDGVHTTVVPPNASVSFYLAPETIFPSHDYDNHKATLSFPTSNTKEGMTLRRYDDAILVSEIAPRGAMIVRLKNKNISEQGILLIKNILGRLDLPFSDQKEFFNGQAEIIDETDWSINAENGIIYLGHTLPYDQDISLPYIYTPVYTLTTKDWEWSKDSTLQDSIVIKETAWKPKARTFEPTVSDGDKVIHLPHMGVLKNRIVLSATESGTPLALTIHPFLKEVPYVNGRNELQIKELQPQTDQVPKVTFDANGTTSFLINKSISQNPLHGLHLGIYTTSFQAIQGFDEDSTLTEFLSHSIDTNYTYRFFVDRNSTVGDDAGRCRVYIKLNYAVANKTYQDPTFTVTYMAQGTTNGDIGLYSIDYKNGILYTQRELNSTWDFSIEYAYANFIAEYRIARQLPSTSYKVDITNHKISVNENEIFSHAFTPRPDKAKLSPYYIVNYMYVAKIREDIISLIRYFSPIVKDYTLKALLKGKMF